MTIPFVSPPLTLGHEARRCFRRQYGLAIPTDEALSAIADLSPIVEVGAGGGYWAALLRGRYRADVRAFDIEPDPGRNPYFDRRWFPVERADATVASQFPDRTLMMIWPPADEPMAHDALVSYTGTRFVYVGEGPDGGETAETFFDLLDREWSQVREIKIPNWIGPDSGPLFEDTLTIWRRSW